MQIFSKRDKRPPDIFQYATLPRPFRVQTVQILQDSLGFTNDLMPLPVEAYQKIHDAACHEYGWMTLGEGTDRRYSSYQDAVVSFIIEAQETAKVLDVIQLAFEAVEVWGSDWQYRRRVRASLEPAEAIAELNYRFMEHGIGYQYEPGGMIIRADSEVAHQDIIKPALLALRDPAFKGANQEYLGAWDHYLHGRYKECLADCLKAFESTMKIICAKRNWPYKQSDTAGTLLKILFEHQIIPDYLQSHFSALRTTLECGVPTMRNIEAGHGQGAQPKEVPEYLAVYQLRLTASAILLFTAADKGL